MTDKKTVGGVTYQTPARTTSKSAGSSATHGSGRYGRSALAVLVVFWVSAIAYADFSRWALNIAVGPDG